MEKRKNECVSCVYSVLGISDDLEDDPILKCHRFPPVIFVIDNEVAQTSPDANYVCGEFKEERNENGIQ